MRPIVLLVPLLAIACEPASRGGGGSGTNGVFVPGSDAGSRDAGVDAGPFDPNRDGGTRDGAVVDSGALDAGGTDASSSDGGSIRDAGTRDGGTRDGGPPAATVGLTFTGCPADFGGEIVVSYNGSIAIGSVREHVLTSSLQFDLDGPGTKALSTRHRIESGEVVNLVIGTTWTNMSTDSDVITGSAPDPIGGTIIVREYVPSAGRVDVDFVQVTLANVTHSGLCRIDGNVRATRISP